MAMQPMGGGGADIDMVDGRPLVTQGRMAQRRQEMEAGLERAALESAELAEELRANPQMLRVLSAQYLSRLDFLASQDAVLLTLEAVINDLNNTLEIIPHLRRQQVRRRMGGLQQFWEEEEATPAAP